MTSTQHDDEYSKMETEEGVDLNSYDRFTKNNKKFWIWFNIATALVNAALAFGQVWISKYDDCGGIMIVVWGLFSVNVVNFLVCSATLCGITRRFCRCTGVSAYVIYQVVILIWANIVYFQSMESNCANYAPAVYFWLFMNILIIYAFIAFVVCFFFRKFCGDPDLILDETIEDTKERMEVWSASMVNTQGGQQ
eukprot:CAMPEP_0176350570 /NCGR_PEP_ID=MMETSP0126-20121128/9581_1 /TAXON_ID=141414 ORGANISM="Strombidinopsis acuminatum, Strain SPMC142" /NCGR_SAMPLE_ID=MMETSP0126 /ASSEMBLY_ACC=CAM_ASM_000229 /LENGTH=193 /DNA_ID=CAMNT_0017700661 /DNA_START=17 /DNA_END=598 /DNA_ORIENTATION=-